MGGKWYCSYPELKECHDPEMLPVDEVRIDPIKVNNIRLGKSIYIYQGAAGGVCPVPGQPGPGGGEA